MKAQVLVNTEFHVGSEHFLFAAGMLPYACNINFRKLLLRAFG